MIKFKNNEYPCSMESDLMKRKILAGNNMTKTGIIIVFPAKK